MNKYILTTIAWLESLAKKELQRIKAENILVNDRMIEFKWDERIMIKANLWSRVGNKVYQVLSERENIDNFDKLYDEIFNINLKNIYKKNFSIIIKVKSIKSKLNSIPAIQKISKKAFIDNITNKSQEKLAEDKNLWIFEITILLIEDKLRVLLNTSWEALHKRWYRNNTWEAPLKENIAAALVLFSNWNFKENFYDIFCGSWTIVIEAAMIAKNIAPWLLRYFAFETLWLVDKKLVEEEIKEAETKIFDWEYKIFASDIDENVLNIAKQNALNAWVSDIINFEKKNFREYLKEDLTWVLVSNPPYWERLKVDNLDDLYIDLDKIFRKNKNLKWWFITSYFEKVDKIIKKDFYKKRKLYNWWEKTYFYKKR